MIPEAVGQTFEVVKPEPAEALYERIVIAWRVSNLTLHRHGGVRPKAREDLIRRLIRRGRESFLKHGHVSALLVTDLGVMAELTGRGRAGFTVEDAGRIDYDAVGLFQVVRPPFGDDRISPWFGAMDDARTAYGRLTGDGAKPKLALAGSVLPRSFVTRILMTADVREWRRLVRLKTRPAAHPLTRELMGMGLAKLKELYPVLFEDIHGHPADAGQPRKEADS